MNSAKATLFMPVENQVRELDSKLLLACIAAKRGFSSVIGSRREMHIYIASFPRGIYLAKSLPVHRNIIFKIMRQLGHEIVAWDEEALVHPQAETYYRRRVCPLGLRYVSHLFAWGEDNAELWHQYPELPMGMPIHVTGNPRGDLLRSQLRALFEKDAEELRKTYGDFILVNTNFNHVNAFSPDLNLFRPVKKPGEEPSFGRAARGMSRDYAEGLRDHKQDIFEKFQNIDWVLSHLGGALPFIYTSMDICQKRDTSKWGISKEDVPPRPLSDYFRNLYVDCARLMTKQILACTIDLYGEEHVMFGSDIPFAYDVVSLNVSRIEGFDISYSLKRKICYENAKRLSKQIH